MKKILVCVTTLFLLAMTATFVVAPRAHATEMTLIVNDVQQSGTITTGSVDGAYTIEAQQFADKVSGLTFYKMLFPPNPGMVLQYGNKLSFVAGGFDTGFSSAAKVEMDTPLQIVDSTTYMCPTNFLAAACGGTITVDAGANTVTAVLPTPMAIGDTVSQAADIAQQLEGEFTIRQGQISLTDAIEAYVAGYLPDCNGNNAQNSYLVTQNPISPRAEVFNALPYGLYMEQDEAFVWVGHTPPTCRYFSFQHYLMNRYYPDETPPIKKIYARLGDSINNYNYPGNAAPYDTFYVLIICSNQDAYDSVRQAVLDAGIPEAAILSLVIPNDTVNFGLASTADALTFLHRATLFDQDTEKDAYIHNMPTEILRLTPKVAKASNPMTPPAARDRQTQVLEQDQAGLTTLLSQLEQSIISTYSGQFKFAKRLKSSTWMYPGGTYAIDNGINVLGETNDTLYLQSEQFVLHDDDLIVVYGVNHEEVGTVKYSNVSCYGAAAFNGIGGITSAEVTAGAPNRLSYRGEAAEFLPSTSTADQEKVYAYKFSRYEHGDNTYILSDNADGQYRGFNNGDTLFIGYRNYVNGSTTVGPYPGNVTDGTYFTAPGPNGGEIYFDQAILFTNTNPGADTTSPVSLLLLGN